MIHGDPERVVVAGDWHGNALFADQVITAAGAGGVQTVVQVGDFGFRKPGPETSHFIAAVDNSCADNGIRILWIEGNRDCAPAIVLESNPLATQRFTPS